MRIVSNDKNAHMAYVVSNREWVRSDGYDTLDQYVENELCIRGDGMYMHSYKGVKYYYVRNVYGLEYNSCSGRYVGSVERGRAILDPWGRAFSVFPYVRRVGGNIIHGYDGYYSQVVNDTVYGDERKVDRDMVVDNVIILATSVCRQIVYCVDILAGEYDSVWGYVLVSVYMKVDNNSHLNYPAINVEWVLNNSGHTLCSYMGNVLDIKNKDTGRDLLRYAGMLDYYVRNEYGYEYKSSRDVHGIMAGRHMMDPWNREFLVFPGDMSSRVGNHGYECYYSGVVYKTVYHNEFKGGDQSDIRHNVMLLTTTVHGRIVYCLDILAGIYDHF